MISCKLAYAPTVHEVDESPIEGAVPTLDEPGAAQLPQLASLRIG
jgi:hypothetical protein